MKQWQMVEDEVVIGRWTETTDLVNELSQRFNCSVQQWAERCRKWNKPYTDIRCVDI